MLYRKKPVVVEAYQTDVEMVIETLEGTMKASKGDYIITGVNGEQYPCKPDIFEKTYEPVTEEHKYDACPVCGSTHLLWNKSITDPFIKCADCGHYLRRTGVNQSTKYMLIRKDEKEPLGYFNTKEEARLELARRVKTDLENDKFVSNIYEILRVEPTE